MLRNAPPAVRLLAMTGTDVDQLLDIIDIQVDAFAVCEIGKEHSLRCDPFETVVVHFVLAGEGYLECEHGCYRLAPGMVVVVPRELSKSLRGMGPIRRVHHVSSACGLQDGLVSFRAFDAEAALVLGCSVLTASAGRELPLFQLLKEPIIQRAETTTLGPLFGVMLDELRKPRIGTRAFVSALMKQIFVTLLRSERRDEPSAMLPMHAGLANAAAAVINRPQDSHTIDSLASSAGMSRSRFNHHFAVAYRCSPKEFVQSARLSSAAKLLMSSTLPVKSVAAAVGYASRSHFSRAFHAKYGKDPSAFRGTPARTNKFAVDELID